jgi:hypothetical protein
MDLNRSSNNEHARDGRDFAPSLEALSPYCLQPHATPKLGSNGMVALGMVPQDFAYLFERLNSNVAFSATNAEGGMSTLQITYPPLEKRVNARDE